MADDNEILEKLMANNRAWAHQVERDHPGFFENLAKQQAPRVLWIGCSDSRVPGNESIGVMPGEVFFHRNVANQLQMVDFNGLSVLQYAVEWLRVRHIIVCGHYGCGGVRAAAESRELGLIDNWLRHIKDIYQKHLPILDAIPDQEQRTNRLCELNVIEQVKNVCHTTIVQGAWQRGQTLMVHGWIYGLQDGLLKDLHVGVSSQEEIEELYRMAVTT